MSKTNRQFKLLYALGILLVVAAHTWDGGVSLAYEWFPPYAFHLGLFVFASGYFYKPGAEEHPLRFIGKKAARLLLPLYIWNVFYGLFVILLSGAGFSIGTPELSFYTLVTAPIVYGQEFGFNLGGWFIIPLFMLQAYNVLLRRLWRGVFRGVSEWALYIVNLLLGMGGIWLASRGYNTGWWLVLVRMLQFLPFYYMGTLYRARLERLDTLPNLPYFTVVFALQLILIYTLGRAPSYSQAWCNNFTDGPAMVVLAGYLGIAFWLRVARILTPVWGESPLVNRIADNTYAIMLHQFLGFFLVKLVFAGMNRFFGLCPEFDWTAFRSDIWYYYWPRGLKAFSILYIPAGLGLPLLIQRGEDKLVERLRETGRKLKERKR